MGKVISFPTWRQRAVRRAPGTYMTIGSLVLEALGQSEPKDGKIIPLYRPGWLHDVIEREKADPARQRAERKMRFRAAMAVMNGHSARQFAVFRATVLDGMRVTDVARVTGVTPSTISGHRAKALTNLDKLMNGEETLHG